MELKTLLQDHEFSGEIEITKDHNNNYVSKDLIKSAALENLISQNEELMQRVKVFSRRLASLEDMNQELQTENFHQKNQISNLNDQIQILKEKDQAWKSKVDELEFEKSALSENLRKLEFLKAEVERFRKYHDKIRLQVKPYITNLKQSRDAAVTTSESIKRQLIHKESQLHDVRLQMQEVLRQSKNQIDEVQKQRHDVIDRVEKKTQVLTDENRELKLQIKIAQDQLLKYSERLEDQASLENRVIELDRTKSELKTRLETEILNLQQKLNQKTGSQTRLEIENQDLKAHILDDQSDKEKREQELVQIRRQLETMRFMWNQKNEESERLTQSLNALENLNLSLSQKLQQIRFPEPQS
jgi:chromosome segregation ATPase